jgi:hypothetical protein
VCLLSVFGPAPNSRSARSAASCRCRWVSLEYVFATSFQIEYLHLEVLGSRNYHGECLDVKILSIKN